MNTHLYGALFLSNSTYACACMLVEPKDWFFVLRCVMAGNNASPMDWLIDHVRTCFCIMLQCSFEYRSQRYIFFCGRLDNMQLSGMEEAVFKALEFLFHCPLGNTPDIPEGLLLRVHQDAFEMRRLASQYRMVAATQRTTYLYSSLLECRADAMDRLAKLITR